jgi:hypothetical protein
MTLVEQNNIPINGSNEKKSLKLLNPNIEVFINKIVK